MNNPFQIMRAMSNPQDMLSQIMNNSQMMQDPRARKTAQLLQNHDTQGLQNMLSNLCNEYGISPDQAENTVKKMFGS